MQFPILHNRGFRAVLVAGLVAFGAAACNQDNNRDADTGVTDTGRDTTSVVIDTTANTADTSNLAPATDTLGTAGTPNQ